MKNEIEQSLDHALEALVRKPDTAQVMEERQGIASLRAIAPVLEVLYEGDELPDFALFQTMIPTE